MNDQLNERLVSLMDYIGSVASARLAVALAEFDRAEKESK